MIILITRGEYYGYYRFITATRQHHDDNKLLVRRLGQPIRCSLSLSYRLWSYFIKHKAFIANIMCGEVQLSTLLSIKTGGCPEDCSYCPQSSRYDTAVEKEKLMAIDEVAMPLKLPKNKVLRASAWARHGVVLNNIKLKRSEMVRRQVKALGMEPRSPRYVKRWTSRTT